MDEIKIKQQVVQRIKEAEKILVTVSDNPSVDELSAALGLTLLLDKLNKYATAIFSGEMPPAIAFLQPEKTFDDSTDSLRDFIIALNKDKADHLRMPQPKPGDDKVRVYVTPYKTTITEADLEFSQGDYNVELVIALGVDKQANLDDAIESHGQILHDADVITVTTGTKTSDLGGIDWRDEQASSLSEMVAGLAEALKTDKTKSLLDDSIATALLTGVVAETDRFSNEHTTAKAMTVAAALMAAGADQQLISAELQPAADASDERSPGEEDTADGNADSSEGSQGGETEAADGDDDSDDSAGDDSMDDESDQAKAAPKSNDIVIKHDHETLADLDKRVMGQEKAQHKIDEEVEALEDAAEDLAEKAEHKVVTERPMRQPAAVEPVQSIADVTAQSEPANAYALDDDDEPALGGTLNATTEQAADDARRAADNDQNKTILSHSLLGQAAPTETASAEAVGDSQLHEAYALTDMSEPALAQAPTTTTDVGGALAGAINPTALTDSADPTIAYGGERVIEPLHDLSSANPVQPAYGLPQTPAPVAAPEPSADFGLPMPPPLPDFSDVMPTMAPGYALPLPQVDQQPELLGDILAPEPVPVVNPQPTVPTPIVQAPAQPIGAYGPLVDIASSAPLNSGQPIDPGQFKIPGQP